MAADCMAFVLLNLETGGFGQKLYDGKLHTLSLISTCKTHA
jgi:hypothetical protein